MEEGARLLKVDPAACVARSGAIHAGADGRDVPDLDIVFIPSDEMPTGLGEPATTVVGPAIGNAIFAATGARVRHWPIRPAAILAALALASPR